MAEPRRGTHKLYKGRYCIVFYDKTGEYLYELFDNVREILKYQGRELTRQNMNLLNVELYRALKTEEHFTTILNGDVMRVFIVNVLEEDL